MERVEGGRVNQGDKGDRTWRGEARRVGVGEGAEGIEKGRENRWGSRGVH